MFRKKSKKSVIESSGDENSVELLEEPDTFDAILVSNG